MSMSHRPKIQLKIKRSENEEAAPSGAEPESVAWLAEQAFQRYQEGVAHGDGNLSHRVRDTYFRAVQLGFVGHMSRWRDRVLAAGNMTMADFPAAPGQGR